MSEEKKSDVVQVFQLEIETELRFQVSANSKVILELKSGTAELFGTELIKSKKYVLSSSFLAIFTWHGCTLELVGKTEVAYVTKENFMMIVYLNIHAAIESRRQKAKADGSKGPNVLVAGPSDVGKSTLCRFLVNYGVRLGWKPMYVDLDVAHAHFSIPGSIGALMVNKTIDIEKGFKPLAPLIYHYGHENPGSNIIHYNNLVSKIAEVIRDGVAQGDKEMRYSGTIVNTCDCEWLTETGYRSINHAASAFEIDVILVIGHKDLYNELVRTMTQFSKQVVYMPYSGAMERSESSKAEDFARRVQDYFYGHVLAPRSPHLIDVKFSDIKIYKIEDPTLPDSFVQQEMKLDHKSLKLIPVQIGPDILNHVLSVTFAENVDEDIIYANVAGFICVSNVDLHRQVVTVLTPHSVLLNYVWLMGDFQFTGTP